MHNSKSTNDLRRCAAYLAIAVFGLCLTSVADDVRKHCVLDWTVKAPVDPAKISQGDLYDRLRYSTGATPFTYSSVQDDTSAFTLPDGTECTPNPVKVVTDEVVQFPALRTSRVAPFIRFTQPLYTNASDVVYVRSQRITLPDSQVSSAVTNEISIVMRLRWRGFVGGYYWTQVFSYGWGWASGKGVCAYIGGGGSSSCGYLTFTIGNGTYKMENSSMLVYTNRWYDIAYTIRQFMDGETRKTVMTAYRCAIPESASYADNNWIKSYCITNQTMPAIMFTGDRNRISTQDSGVLKERSSSDERHFRGDIQRIAVYSKELNADEVRQAFTGESEQISLGVQNAKADEFSDSASGEFDADTMAWHQFRKTLTAENPSVVISKKLDSRWATRTHILRFGVLPDANRTSPNAYLKISVNGERVGRVKLGPEGTNCCVCLPESLMANVMKAEDDWLMSLTIERERKLKFKGNVKFDYLHVGGPWQIGVQDNNYEELGPTSQYGMLTRYHVAAWNDTKCVRSTYTGSNYAPQKLYFTLSAEEAANLDFNFVYRSCSYAYWKLLVNGVDYDTRFFDTHATRHVNYTWTFPAGTFRAGINCLELVVPMDRNLTEWNNHDMFRFTVGDFYPGSLYTGPLGFGTKMIVQ